MGFPNLDSKTSWLLMFLQSNRRIEHKYHYESLSPKPEIIFLRIKDQAKSISYMLIFVS